MRFRSDGLPRDLPLSEPERRQLRDRVRAWKLTTRLQAPLLADLIPGGVSFVLMLVWMPVLWGFHSPWRYAVVVSAVLVQLPLTFYLMRRALWKHTCRGMAASGYEVCPRCAYPMREIEASSPVCPECGSTRVSSPGRSQ